jgi:hypothetical protein
MKMETEELERVAKYDPKDLAKLPLSVQPMDINIGPLLRFRIRRVYDEPAKEPEV